MSTFQSIDEALVHASGGVPIPATVPGTGPAPLVSQPGVEVEAWEEHREARAGEQAFTFLASALEPARRVSSLNDAFFARIADFRQRIPAIPEVPANARRTPSWALQNVGKGISSNGGHPDAVAAQNAFLEERRLKSEKTFEAFLTDPSPSDTDNPARQIRAYRLADRVHQQALTTLAAAEQRYEQEKAAFAADASRDRARALRAAIADMEIASRAMDSAELEYERARPPFDEARRIFYQAMSLRSFIDQEGNIDSISTADDNAFTWGIGFANTGGIPSLFKRLFEQSLLDPHPLAKARTKIRKLFHAAGFVIQPRNDGGGRYLIVDPIERRVLNIDHNDTGQLNAVHGGKQATRDRSFLHLLAWIARDPLTAPAVVSMQMEGRLAGYVENGPLSKHLATLSVYGMVAKMRHAIVPFSAVGATLDFALRKAWSETREAEARRRTEDQRFDWERYEDQLRAAIAAGDPVDPGAQASLARSGRRGGHYRVRRLELEPPSQARDLAVAHGALQYLCHCYELSRLASVQLPLPRPGSPETWLPRTVGPTSRVYTQFRSWFHQQGARHWQQWIGQAPPRHALGKSLYLDAPVALRDYLAARYPEAMRSPQARFEDTPRGAALRREIDAREARRAGPLQELEALKARLAKGPPDNEPSLSYKRLELLWDSFWENARIQEKLEEASAPTAPPPKRLLGERPPDTMEYDDLQREYEQGVAEAAEATAAYYFVNVTSSEAMAKGQKAEELPIGFGSEIWELWPQRVKEMTVTPLTVAPNRYELAYMFQQTARLKWISLTFNQGEPREPREEVTPSFVIA